MKKFLKISLLLSFLFITTSFGEKYGTEIYIPWKVSGSGYWTNLNGYAVYNDFEYMVSRSTSVDQYGYYYYDFWFYSQSYYWDGYNATYTSTNIRNVIVQVNEGYGYRTISYDYTPLGISFFSQYSPLSLRIKSKSYNPLIIMRWNNMSAI